MLKYYMECNVRGCGNHITEHVVQRKQSLTTLPKGWVRIGAWQEDCADDVHLCPKHSEMLQVNEGREP